MPTQKEKQIFYSVRIGESTFDVTGRKRTRNGYVAVCVHGHPNTDSNGYMMEHRLIMEMFIGRFLATNEAIHHKNHVKHDNRISNLEVIDPVEHTLKHHLGAKRGKEARKNISEGMKRRLSNKKNHPSYKNIDDELTDLIKKGCKVSKIASELKVTRRTIYNKIDYLGLRDIYDK